LIYVPRGPNGKRVSRAQGLPPNYDDDHADYLSLKGARVGVGCNTGLGQITRSISSDRDIQHFVLSSLISTFG
jgi:hypothetical protein